MTGIDLQLQTDESRSFPEVPSLQLRLSTNVARRTLSRERRRAQKRNTHGLYAPLPPHNLENSRSSGGTSARTRSAD